MAKTVSDNLPFTMEQREFKLFRALVHERTGIYLRDGKQVMLASRLSRRLRHLGLSSFAQYYDHVQHCSDQAEEIGQLINCVTTNKTSFFRERHHFDYLANTVVPQIQAAERLGGPRSLRIWSAACSTGEEPYSIVITLLEALQDKKIPVAASGRGNKGFRPSAGSWKIDVVASDIDTAVLNTGQRAIYNAANITGVSRFLLERYLLRGKDEMTGFVKVKPEAARMVQFRRINLMDAQWPLEGRFDVIFFRNALIYFKQETQDVFLRKMARSLNPRGYLFLGNSEHIPWLNDIYEPLQQTMYRLRS